MITIGSFVIPLQLQIGEHQLYINNFISFAVLLTWLIYFCGMFNNDYKRDKALHTLVSFVGTAGLIGCFNLFGWAWWIAPIVVMLIGIGKEIVDLLNPKKRLFDKMDLVADAFGIVTVLVIYYISFVCFVA